MDSNFVRDPPDKKSVIGYYFFFNRAIISSGSKKQKTVSTSTIEAGYIILGHTTREAVWIKRFINKMKLEVIESLMLHGDNKITIALTKNAES